MTAAERPAAEAADGFTVGYVADLEPFDELDPYLRTVAESPYVPLELGGGR